MGIREKRLTVLQMIRFGAGPAEWLILTGVLVVLLSVTFPPLVAYRQAQMGLRVEMDFVRILSASHRFFDEYDYWPTEHTGKYGDYRYGYEESNAAVMNVLRSMDGEGNYDHATNPKQIVFIELGESGKNTSGLDGRGALVDPWGTEYQIVIDTDLNGSCNIDRSIYSVQYAESIVMWSCGPDRITDTADDILSWKMKLR
ncbi:MAG: hypothetical protein KJ626_06745 [Verrucomicrobia bacterium]|nr:hypothetical protein [Verrucomicrobiota bacterium]